MPLSEIRKKIDATDEKLLDLLNQRADLVHEVGLVKQKEGVGIYAPEREEALLQSLIKRNKGRLPEKSIRAIYREIMSASLALEKHLTIAYLGPEATWSHQAARSKFGASVEYTAQDSIASVFDAVARGKADYGVVPIENSIEGAVNYTLDVFMDSELKICAQFLLEIEKGIQDNPGNTTRYLVIGPHACPPTGDDKTSLMFCVHDKPDALFDAIKPFKELGINMSKIESRPSMRKDGEYFFFVDVDGHAQDAPVAKALDELRKHCTLVKILGSYPRMTGC